MLDIILGTPTVLTLILSYLATSLVTWFVICSSWLFVRYLRAKFGRRIEVNGRQAILITGASSGFGLAVAKHLYKLGFSVFATYYNDKEPGYRELVQLERQANSSREAAPTKKHLFLIRLDVRSVDSISECAKQVDEKLELHQLKLSRLINNAGVSTDGPFEWSSARALSNVVETNLLGTMRVSRQFIYHIIRNKGRIVNVSSGLHVVPCATVSAYGASKAGLAYLSDSVNQDIGRYGASCVCVFPGNLATTTNIVYTRIQGIQESKAALSEKELQLYARSIIGYQRFMTRLVGAHVRLTNSDASQLSETYQVELESPSDNSKASSDTQSVDSSCDPSERNRGQSTTKRRLRRWLSHLVMQASGGAIGASLELSGVLIAFERAVMLENPPGRLYAGNAAFTNFYGPLADFIPSELFRQVGSKTWKIFAI